MRLFDRVASVEIGRAGEDGVLIRGLRIAFQVVKTASTPANTASITIWNLASTTRNELQDGEQVVRLRCGYSQDGEEIVFVGQVDRVVTGSEPPDVVTEIECADGILELRQVRVSISLTAGATAQQALDIVAEQLAIPVRPIDADLSGEFLRGFSYYGRASEALDKIVARFGLEWSIQNGELQVLERGTTTQNLATVLSPETGLVGSPKRLISEGGQLVGTQGTEPGWEVLTLLQPKLEPGDVVQLKARDVAGEFRIERVEHSGDTRGQDWYSQLEVSEIE